jgi:hypothetical protein
MNDEMPLELTPASLAKLWREIALYLEIWELIRGEPWPAHVSR